MLDEAGVEYEYREYTEEPLSVAEIRKVLGLLGVGVHEILRRRDKMFKELGLSGSEPQEELISLIASYPTLMERPIAVQPHRAIIGRPP